MSKPITSNLSQIEGFVKVATFAHLWLGGFGSRVTVQLTMDKR